MKIVFLILTMLLTLQAKQQTIVFGAGCFWGVEKHFEQKDGVIDVKSGYAGGNYENPDYDAVLKYRANPPKGVINHAEVVQVRYDDSKISTKKLIQDFWELHDPTQGDRQGNDIGNNYRSALFYTNKTQKEIALETKEIYQKLLSEAGFGQITTQIEPLDKFYAAKAYHQDYLKKNPDGYCPNHATGVKFEENGQKQTIITPLGGKEIVVIDAKGCPYCKKFKEDVTSSYEGDIPLRTVRDDQLKGFTLVTELNVAPIILLIKDGKEIFSYRGYLDPQTFYEVLAIFKFGMKSEAYNIAYKQGTEPKFCKQYEKFKDTPDGVFVDSLSGDILFDTRDRFDSGSGWLSFYKAVDGATIQREDTSHGMTRTEVIAKKSGMHLGHVFDDAPGGKKRFCINATVLDFVPRDQITE